MKKIVFALLILTVASCHKEAEPVPHEFREAYIPAGHHAVTPYDCSYERTDREEIQWVWTASSEYELDSGDQTDWNKLTGLSFHLFTNHTNSAMVAWRWNPDSRLVEISPYFHVDGRVVRHGNLPDIPMITAELSQETRTHINTMQWIGEDGQERNAVGITIITPMGQIYYEQPFEIDVKQRARRINPWFGGNRVAPHDIYFVYRKIE